MVTVNGDSLAPPRADLEDKRSGLSGKMAQIEAALARCDAANPVFYEDDESQAGGRLDVQSSAKAGLSHPGKMPSITWLAPSMQATEEYFTSAG